MAQLENLAELTRAVSPHSFILAQGRYVVLGDLYCEECRGRRRVKVWHLFTDDNAVTEGIRTAGYQLVCTQCDSVVLAVIYKAPAGPQLALLRSTRGGGATKHTPEAVAYYLDQAARSQSVGAFSASVVMYRSALEHLLHEQGFNQPMCNAKIVALEAAIANNTAPRWARDLEPEDLRILNRLGNGAVHTNGGDVTKQQELDHDLVVAIALTFEALLEAVYERPKKVEERRNQLGAAAAKLR